MKSGIELITEERLQQIEKHNRTIDSDVYSNDCGELRIAAMGLLNQKEDRIYMGEFPAAWDEAICEHMASKPYRERLIISGSLIAAEIDRIQYLDQLRMHPFKNFVIDKLFKNYKQYYETYEDFKEHFDSGEVKISVGDINRLVDEFDKENGNFGRYK